MRQSHVVSDAMQSSFAMECRLMGWPCSLHDYASACKHADVAGGRWFSAGLGRNARTIEYFMVGLTHNLQQP